MPQSQNVLVAMGLSDKGNVPQQTYNNLFTEFNINTLSSSLSDADFYNKAVRSPSSQGVSDFAIYGFLPGNYTYKYDYSMKRIVDFFQSYNQIEVVMCDIIEIYSNDFQAYQYIHPSLPTNNIPFFIKSSIKDKIEFQNDKTIFQNQLQRLQQAGHIIFHIAEPLISLNKGSE